MVEKQSSTDTRPVHDDEYYFRDGNCVLLVENRLFKLHRFILERNSIFFKSLFSLQPDESAGTESSLEGSSDENPIVCHDTLESFRALCWVLYASPIEICAMQRNAAPAIAKLVHVAKISHKYECSIIEGWVLDILHHDLSESVLKKVSVEDLELLLSLASEYGQELEKKIKECFLDMLLNSSDPLQSLVKIIGVAERTGDRVFQAKVYYSYLKATDWKTNNGSEATFSPDSCIGRSLPGLTTTQCLRLRSGYLSLMLLEQELRYPKGTQCRYNNCWSDWSQAYSVKNAYPASLISSLAQALVNFPQYGPCCGNYNCASIRRTELDKLIEWNEGTSWQDRLVNFFLGEDRCEGLRV